MDTKRTVILIDDEPIVRLDLRQMLEDAGYRVLAEGSDGYDAEQLCRAHHPDIVLLDLEMPVFDGMSAARTIVGECLAECVVICTGYMDAGFIEEAGRIGVSGYLVKPVEERMLKPTLEIAWSQRKRIEKLENESEGFQNRISELKIIEQAKGKLAKEKHINEAEAYRLMQRLSMEKRTPLVSIARTVLRRAAEAQKTVVVRVDERRKHG